MTASLDTSAWDRIEFVFSPSPNRPEADEVLVGLGDPRDSASSGVVLNSKFPGSPYRSVSSFVRGANSILVDQWKGRLTGGAKAIRRVFLEDLSLDSCFAFLLFLHRLNPIFSSAPDSDLPDWEQYVTRWEEGYTRSEPNWDESIAFLMTALGHSYLTLAENDRPLVPPERFTEGAKACLSLLAAAIAQVDEPRSLDVRRLDYLPACHRARVHLQREFEQYRLTLHQGTRCQLRVPLAWTDQSVLVDALFIEEHNPSGVLKAFARSDYAGSWTGRGFDVLGIFRPLASGTGADMTISVAPESGLTLRTLWHELERLEEKCWAGERPCNEPREIESYRNTRGSPNEPWWDDYGRYSLLGAPKAVHLADGRTSVGTKLDWHRDVLPAVWTCFSPIPLKALDVQTAHEEGGKRLVICSRKTGRESDGTGLIVEATSMGFASPDAPTFRSWLRVLSAPDGHLVSPAELPPESSYRVFDLLGSFVLAHRDGATIYDNQTLVDADRARVLSVFKDLAAASNMFAKFHADRSLERALDYQQRLLASEGSGQGKGFDEEGFEHWKIKSMSGRAAVLKAGVGAINHADPWPLNELRDLLQSMWGLDKQREAAMDLADRIDKVTSEIAAHMRERRSMWFQGVVTAVGVGILLKEVVEVFEPLYVDNLYKWQLRLAETFLPPEAIKSLEAVTRDLHHWHVGAAVALGCGCALGWFGYRWFGAKAASH